MIGFFPDPYPDELLYSVCARFSYRTKYLGNKAYTLKELFGNRCATATIALPCHLEHLVSVLPPGHSYTVERLINYNTLLPFYRPFLPPERVMRLQEMMRGASSQAAHLISGTTPSSIRSPNWLRFCPICTEDDKKRLGEGYWHRLHQLPGVEVCPIHKVFLENSNASARNRLDHYKFISAEEAIHLKSAQPLDLTNRCHKALLKVAQDAAWLLSQYCFVPSYEFLSDQYLRLLVEQRLAYESGIIHSHSHLLKDFKNYYSPDFLKILQCEVEVGKNIRNNWLSSCIHGRNKVNHPLRHLLLIQFLGYTVEEFFQLPPKVSTSEKPFGEPPWPCLNPVSGHFLQLVIEECHITRNRVDDKPVAAFHCICGFNYRRKGPDLSIEDRLRKDSTINYGPEWQDTLKSLWEDRSISFHQIQQRLGADHKPIKRQAFLLGLPFPRLGPSGTVTHLCQERASQLKSIHTRVQDSLEAYRRQWLLIRRDNPKATRSSLYRKFPGIYGWLDRNDSQWLKAHLPPLAPSWGTSGRVDWESRDMQLTEAVKSAASCLKNTLGRPIRVTIQTIGREIDQRSILHREFDKLPLTAKALSEVLDTDEEYYIRRIWWVTDCFRQENKHPKREQLIKRANINLKLVAAPQIQEVIEAALQFLEP
jgi:hypothetical protein